ncbi:hypothetical protein [Mycobacterium montefiorense]|nr:hypothetical protein [Mycobacterium montefiorense]GKU39459.1 hypothetical protein NJB14192_14520 [Mycobacterium montefiorense]GKU44552.1 hypothetical protein NJB14194_11790 [Mycobacterium montefiorense]GKU60615.1 hypothetical protein NJB18182_11190 [Mycobacterium montefiorense]GKU66487.1 hypothetical protein NJB18183_16350 [Mycobacterium montefiorense]
MECHTEAFGHRAQSKERGKREQAMAEDYQGGTVQFNATTFHDSVLPVKLNFRPPLAKFGSDPSTFAYQWQLLTYAFNLPDPARFPRLPGEIPAEDMRRLKRYVHVCEKTAKYTVVAHKGGITLHGENGDWSFDIDQTDDEQTVGFATRFRQLHHSSTGDPDFSVVINLLNKYARQFRDGRTAQRLAILDEWKKARGALMNRPLPNIVDRIVLEKDHCPNIDDVAMYNDVNPDKLINFFNYGELIHFGKHSEEYDKLAEDPELEAIQHNNFMQSMLGLVHLYFGFSEVIRAATQLKRGPV